MTVNSTRPSTVEVALGIYKRVRYKELLLYISPEYVKISRSKGKAFIDDIKAHAEKFMLQLGKQSVFLDRRFSMLVVGK